MSASRKKILRNYITAAKEAGWRVELRNCNHWGFFPVAKEARPIFTGGTPTDHRSLDNLRAQLRRAGLEI